MDGGPPGLRRVRRLLGGQARIFNQLSALPPSGGIGHVGTEGQRSHSGFTWGPEYPWDCFCNSETPPLASRGYSRIPDRPPGSAEKGLTSHRPVLPEATWAVATILPSLAAPVPRISRHYPGQEDGHGLRALARLNILYGDFGHRKQVGKRLRIGRRVGGSVKGLRSWHNRFASILHIIPVLLQQGLEAGMVAERNVPGVGLSGRRPARPPRLPTSPHTSHPP